MIKTGSMLAALAAFALSAAGSAQAADSAGAVPTGQGPAFTLREGDIVKITFPGAPDLNPPEPLQIRRDGKITLPIIGEVMAADRTPSELQNNLIGLYSKQIQSKEVVVTVISSSFSVFVDGAVLHSGKITVNHPLSILEAVMEAGGFDYNKANTEKISVIRKQEGADKYTYYTVNLKAVIAGKQNDLFYLQPGDMVHVPERFAWY
jgi:polysaccharide export outer membrane protein